MPAKRLQTYATDAIRVTFDPNVCIHAGNCVRGLGIVFSPQARPWVRPERASADDIARVVATCPTGALHYERLDGGAAEVPDERVSVRVSRGGPLYVRGPVEVALDDGTLVRRDGRVALCRCGLSGSQPFCDGSHKRWSETNVAAAPPAPPAEGGPAVGGTGASPPGPPAGAGRARARRERGASGAGA